MLEDIATRILLCKICGNGKGIGLEDDLWNIYDLASVQKQVNYNGDFRIYYE